MEDIDRHMTDVGAFEEKLKIYRKQEKNEVVIYLDREVHGLTVCWLVSFQSFHTDS